MKKYLIWGLLAVLFLGTFMFLYNNSKTKEDVYEEINPSVKDISRTAFETLLWRFDNPEAEKRRIMLAAELVVRESTAR